MTIDINVVPVSVIIPSFNSKQWLSQCIDSINFGVKPSEILIIDDCSTDGSYEFAQELSVKHENITILKTPVNSGIAAARKAGFIAASNDLVAIVDADDLIERDALMDAFLKITEDVDLCIWNLVRIDNNGQISKTTANPQSLPISGEQAALLTLGHWRIHPLGVARKYLYLDAYKDFFVDSVNSDELITRLLLRRARKIVGSEKKYFYRINSESSSLKFSIKHLSVWRSNLWLIKFAMDLKNAPIDILVKQSIYSSFIFWKKRDVYGWQNVRKEMRSYAWSLAKLAPAWRFMAKNPKYFLFYCFLLFVTTTGINI